VHGAISAKQVLQHGGEFDGAITLHAVAGTVDHPNVDLWLTAARFGNIVIVDDR
jgi:hypothetical protein